MPKKVVVEAVNHPSHYNQGQIEAIEVIEDQEFNFHAGSALKYIYRYRAKGNPIQDLKKAIWYLQRLIDLLERQ